MAQTSTRKKSPGSRSTSGRSRGSTPTASSSRGSSSTRNRQSRNGSGGASARKSAASRSGRSRTRTSSRRRSSSSSRSGSPADTVQRIASKGKDTVAEGAQSGGEAISTVAGKVKGPALAGAATLAGLAGGVALGARRNSGRKVFGMRVGNGFEKAARSLAEATRNASRFSENFGQLASEVRQTREAIASGSKQRSPIEVVLQALTARR
jgi:hypothetical protein